MPGSSFPGLLVLALVSTGDALAVRSAHPSARPGAVARSRSPLLVEKTETKPAPFAFFQRSVPQDQQPVFELQNLRSQAFYDWAESDERYKSKLFGLYAGLMLFLSLPISYTTYNQLPFELPQLFLAANIGTLVVMIPFVYRLRVGWGFVSKRLRAKSSYYEAEQRGLIARKDRETQTRDRLIEKSEVSPNLRRIDVSLLALFAGLILNFVAAEVVTVIEGENGPSTLKTLSGDDAIEYTNRKAAEDGSGLKPAYCDSRYYKILAGGNGQGGVGCN